MMRSQKIFVFGIIFPIFLTNFSHVAYAATSLSDITGNKNQVAIQWLYDNKIISGYSDGTFKPENNISRAELLKILVEAKKDHPALGQYKNCFPDVREEWFAPFVCYAKEQQWVKGYTDNSFHPEQNITKAEAMKMLVNSRGYELSPPSLDEQNIFDDVESKDWYYLTISSAKEKGLLEQTSGVYGATSFITRGEISENTYRAIIIDEYGLKKFSQSQMDCSKPIREFGDIAVEKDTMKVVPLLVCKGYRYTACLQNPSGNPDLYGGSTPPTIDTFEEKSTDDVITTTNEDGTESQIPRQDCITFEPKDMHYYQLGIFGAASNSKTNIWVSSSKMSTVPAGFEKSLVWFADGCTQLTTPEYGPFNTPWGNDGDLDRPFYEGYPNYIHGGTDYACAADTIVKSMCDGFIADSNDAGGDWGWHTVVECKNNNDAISIAVIHLQQESVLPIGTEVHAGDVIGKVFALDVPGELEHIHLTACQKSHTECEAAGFQPERGASRRTEWWGAREFWFDMDWQTNPGLYKVLPTKK